MSTPLSRKSAIYMFAALFLAGPAIGRAVAADATYAPSPELLAAAKKEGKLVLYTANFLTTEQTVIKRFSERFPGIQVEMVRARDNLSRASGPRRRRTISSPT